MKLIQLALKVLLKFRLYFIINLLGLILSLTSGIILIRYIHQELTVDHYVNNLNRTYVFIREFLNQPPQLGGNIDYNNDPNYVDILADPAVEAYTTFLPSNDTQINVNNQQYRVNAIITDSLFLELLPHPVLAGSSKLRSPTDVIITHELAKRLFGNEDPLGKTLKYSTGQVLTVSGVLDKPVTKSSVQFDMLVSIELNSSWGRMDFNIIRLYPNTDVIQLNEKYSEFIHLTSFWGAHTRLQFFPLKELYMDTQVGLMGMKGSIFNNGNYKNVLVLSAVVLLLVIGFFNYANIYTVLMLNRAREFGMKKVFGANGWKIFAQIWMENLLLTLAALVVVWALIEVGSGLIENWLSISIHTATSFDIGLSVTILLVFPLLTTVHPALKYNSAPPVTSLRSVNIAGRSVVSRVLFLSLQYMVTFVIVVISLFFIKQLYYMLNADLGYRTTDIVTCQFISPLEAYDIHSKEEFERRRDKETQVDQTIRQKMSESTLFDSWSQGEFPLSYNAYVPLKKDDGDYKKVALAHFTLESMKLFEFQLLEGRLWDDDKDNWAQYKCIINETAKQLFEIKDITTEYLQPERRLWWSSDVEGMDTNPSYEIVGVIKDFKTNHLSQANVPVVIVYNTAHRYTGVIAAIKPGKRNEAINFLKDIYIELWGESDFEYSFLEDEIATLYQEDKLVSRIYTIFAVIAIIISCLGLYGLSLFDIRQRYREIALRKINGASAQNITRLLQRKYAYILAGSFLVAVPVSYWVIKKYLEGFAHQAPVSWWLFAVAGLFVAGISFLTLNIQIRKAMRINPAEVLKGE